MTIKSEKPVIRYRTESFSGEQVRDAAQVMAFETFYLGNTDILECLQDTILKGNPICEQFSGFIRELDNNGFVDDMSTDDKEDFFKTVLQEIRKATGLDIKYALWLADKETVAGFYGRHMSHEQDFESYEIGPVVLSELGFDGTLYGYVDCPVSFEERAEHNQSVSEQSPAKVPLEQQIRQAQSKSSFDSFSNPTQIER